MSRKVFENDRHRITRGSGSGLFDSIANSVIGLKDPVKISIYDKKSHKWGHGISGNTREAEDRAWRDLKSKNNR